MTNDNQFKPTNQHFKELRNLPQTETRIILNDWSQPVKKSNLSPAARKKVVNRSGSNYLSESKDYGPCSYSGCPYSTPFDLDISIQGCKWWDRNPNCGTSLPGYWDKSPTGSYYSRENLRLNHVGHGRDADSLISQNNLYTVNTVGLYAAEDEKFCEGAQNLIRECVRVHEQGDPINETKTLPSNTTKWTKWTIKTAVAIGSVVTANPVGLAVAGGVTWAGSEVVKSACDNDKVKNIWDMAGGAGQEALSGGIGRGFEKLEKFVGIPNVLDTYTPGVPKSKTIKNINMFIDPLKGDMTQHLIHQATGKRDPDCPLCD